MIMLNTTKRRKYNCQKNWSKDLDAPTFEFILKWTFNTIYNNPHSYYDLQCNKTSINDMITEI